MDIEKLLEELRYEDLTSDMQLIADYQGLEAVKNLFSIADGISVNIPKVQFMNDLVIRYLKKHKYENEKKIARDIDRSHRWVSKRLKEIKKEMTG